MWGLVFLKVQNGTGSETEGWLFQGRFHDADIDDDMILGYPWLQEHNVAVPAGEDALGVGREIRDLLVGWPEQEKPEKDESLHVVPKWSVRKLVLAIDGVLDEEGIPTPWRLNEDEMVGVMRMCEAAEKG